MSTTKEKSIATEARGIARLRRRATIPADFLELDRAFRRLAGLPAKEPADMRIKAQLVLDYPFRADLVASLSYEVLALIGKTRA